MKPNVFKIFTALVAISLISAFFAVFSVRAASTPRIYLDPSNNVYTTDTTSIGYKFNITAWVQDAPDIGAWQVYMEFNDSILNVTRWFEPTKDPQYIFTGKTTSANPTPPNPGYVHLGAGKARVQVAGNLFPTPPAQDPSSGTGKLCIFECIVTAAPTDPGTTLNCTLRINDSSTTVLDADGNDVAPLTKENGYYEITKPAAPPVMFTLNIAVNFGGTTNPAPGAHAYNEGENATVQAIPDDGYALDRWELNGTNLGNATSVNVTMTANYTLLAVFKSLGNEGDVNGDGVVDVKDAYLVAMAFGSYGPNYLYPGSPAHPRWNPKCDIYPSNTIDLKDYFIVRRNYGKIYTPQP